MREEGFEPSPPTSHQGWFVHLASSLSWLLHYITLSCDCQEFFLEVFIERLRNRTMGSTCNELSVFSIVSQRMENVKNFFLEVFDCNQERSGVSLDCIDIISYHTSFVNGFGKKIFWKFLAINWKKNF